MKPDMTTHDFARILPKKIPQDKERLYSEALQLKQSLNEVLEENVRLKTKISILEKEKDKMNKFIDHAPEVSNNRGNSRLQLYTSKMSEVDYLRSRNKT
jgi:regulator of replication initiation timing